jgi:hypothetical protein
MSEEERGGEEGGGIQMNDFAVFWREERREE